MIQFNILKTSDQHGQHPSQQLALHAQQQQNQLGGAKLPPPMQPCPNPGMDSGAGSPAPNTYQLIQAQGTLPASLSGANLNIGAGAQGEAGPLSHSGTSSFPSPYDAVLYLNHTQHV